MSASTDIAAVAGYLLQAAILAVLVAVMAFIVVKTIKATGRRK